MACINADGTLVSSAFTLLAAAQTARTATEIATLTGLPLYRVRSSLRELVQAQLLREGSERYALTKAGQARLAARERPITPRDDQSQ
jgi:DNA-binding IclR family transcriptional regulator